MSTRTSVTALSLSFTLLACGSSAVLPPAALPALTTAGAAPASAPSTEPVRYESPVGEAIHWRNAGDYAVYKFSGKLRGKIDSMVEYVAALEGDLAVIDLTVTEKSRAKTMRLRVGNAPGWDQVVFAAAWLDASGAEQPVPVSAYEALLAGTVVTADQNYGLFSQEAVSLKMHEREVAGRKINYLVQVGKRQAFLSLTQSTDSVATDVAGELRALDGALLYRAELADVGNALLGISGAQVVSMN